MPKKKIIERKLKKNLNEKLNATKEKETKEQKEMRKAAAWMDVLTVYEWRLYAKREFQHVFYACVVRKGKITSK